MNVFDYPPFMNDGIKIAAKNYFTLKKIFKKKVSLHLKMVRKSKILNLCATTILCLFASFYVNITMSWHAHNINGVTILHSHIHAENHHSTPDGEHSTQELILINIANSLLSEEAIAPQQTQIFLPKKQAEQIKRSFSVILLEKQDQISLRAPPLM